MIRQIILALAMIIAIMTEGQTSNNTSGRNDLKQTLNALPEGHVLKSTFHQRRHLKDIPHALTSSGEIVMLSGKGLLWKTITPFPTALLMTKKGLYQLDQSQKTSLVSQQKGAHEGALFNILSKVLNGSFDELAGFTVKNQKPPQSVSWRVQLTPPPAIQKVMTALIIDGNGINQERYISHITIIRPNGDKDEISFEKPQIYTKKDQDKVLTSQEKKWLND